MRHNLRSTGLVPQHQRPRCFFLPSHVFAHTPMPVSTTFPVQQFSQEDFGKVAFEVVGHAFAVHNALGRKFHESVYKGTLQQLLSPRSVTEFAITLSHGSFVKNLYVDLLVDAGCPFELKSVARLSDSHLSQLIQYLMLLDLRHGKLINFGAEKVEHQFVNCHESTQQRQQFDLDRRNWSVSRVTTSFEQTVVALVKNWGTGLSRSLYEEACVHMFGGKECCERLVETYWNGRTTGRQPVKMIDDGVAFEITCKRKDLAIYASHLQKLLVNSNLRALLWANIVSGTVRFECFSR
jgi:GxxExxY protein